MRRTTATALTATALLVAGAVPAWGHATLDQDSVPRDSEATLNVRVPVEPKDHGGDDPDLNERFNSKVSVEIPAGFAAVGCNAKPGWECRVNPKSGKTPHHVAYTRTGGPNDAEDVFDFQVTTPGKTGEYKFEINQTYSDGDVVQWAGDKDSATPASFVTVE
jgi:uncharacterized protein YcnI